MKFQRYQELLTAALTQLQSPTATTAVEPSALPSLVLAYIGDAWFSLFVRTRLLTSDARQVRVLHTLDAAITSAVWQAYALRLVEPDLSATELAIIRRGRNAKSRLPKNTSVDDYHASTGLEALMGYLLLAHQTARLEDLAGRIFQLIINEINAKHQGGKR